MMVVGNWTQYPSKWQNIKRFGLQEYIEEYLVRKAQHPSKVLEWKGYKWLVSGRACLCSAKYHLYQ